MTIVKEKMIKYSSCYYVKVVNDPNELSFLLSKEENKILTRF